MEQLRLFMSVLVAPVPAALPATRPPSPGPLPRHSALAFASAPALLPACAFAAGIALASCHWIMPGWCVAGLAPFALCVVFAAAKAPRALPLALVALFGSLGLLAAELQRPIDPQTQLGELAAASQPASFLGEVVRLQPAHATTYTPLFGHGSRTEQEMQIDLRISSVELSKASPQPLRGGMRLTVYADQLRSLPPLRCGTLLRATFAPREETRYRDPGVWNAAEWMHSQGIGALGSVSAAQVKVLGRRDATLPCLLHSLQSAGSARVLALAEDPRMARLPAFLRLTPVDASMLTAMLTGDRSALETGTRIGFERTGSFHLLVVSGLHLGIFASVVALLTRRLRLGRIAGTAVTLILCLAYAVFTGFGEPVQRSLAMVAIYLLCRLLYRERAALQALGLTTLLLAAADPRALLGASLQMTLLTVIAIAGLAVPLAQRSFEPYLRGTRQLFLIALDPTLPPRVAQWRVCLRLLARHLEPRFGRLVARRFLPSAIHLFLRGLELLAASAVVELVMSLPMALYFHRITVMGLPVNVLVIPLLGLLLPAAMVCFVTLLVLPSLAWLPGAVTAALLHIVSAVIGLFAHLRWGDYRLPGPPAPRVLLWLLVLTAAVAMVRMLPRWAPAAGLSLLLLSAGLVVAPQHMRYRPGTLEVSAIDVGQGDAILVISPAGKTMLVDAGGLVGQSPASRFDVGEDVVSPALWSRGIRHLDAVAITHGHWDHIGGMRTVLANFHPDELLVGNNPPSPTYDAVLQQAGSEHIPVVEHRQGDRWMWDPETQITVLWPSVAYRPGPQATNNDSLVLRLQYRDTSALLEGDAEAAAEQGMLAAGLEHADLLKVGHHGSSSSSIPPFLAAVAPQWGVISCGRHNFYKHPRPATLQHLQQDGIRTFRTDLSGETDFFLDGEHVVGAPWAAFP